MYPVAAIILVGVGINSKETQKFIFPFVWLGMLFSIYHNLVYFKVIEVIVPCNESAPCTAQNVNYLGFITIPLLALFAFVVLVILNYISIRNERRESYEK